MKKYRVLEDIFVCKKGEIIEVPDNERGRGRTINYNKCLSEGILEEVKQGFKEEVEEIFKKYLGDFFENKGWRKKVVQEVAELYKEERKKRFLEIVEKQNKAPWGDTEIISVKQLIKAINEE